MNTEAQEPFVARKINKDEDLNPDGDILSVMRVKDKLKNAIEINSIEVNKRKWHEILLGSNISDKPLDKMPPTIIKSVLQFSEEKMRKLNGQATTVISHSQINDTSDFLSSHGMDFN
mmetsp:Transcript_14819/g.13027  ORF Transcript_14819/g.13027 Transcript_14819/m.13027 type:complete len:117 (-) Transcript_14819:95-445(-)